MDVSSSAALTLEQLRSTARDLAMWLKVLGVANIVIGVPTALALFGLVYIWLGVVLFQAGTAAETASDDELVTMLGKLRTYFIVMTVVTVLGVVLTVFYLLAMLALLGGLLGSGGFDF